MKKILGCVTCSLLCLLILLASCLPAAAAGLPSGSSSTGAAIDNAAVTEGSLSFYVTADTGKIIGKDDVSVTLGGSPLAVTGVDRFSTLDEGTAYVLVVDVSGSMKTQIANIKTLLDSFADKMSPDDVAALVTVSGEIHKGGFLSDRAALKADIGKISASNQDTNLYRGISESLDLLGAYKSPSDKLTRRAAVILSDGGEDNSGGITKDELTDKIITCRYPVFTCSLLPANPTAKQIEMSKIFGSFARISAGGRDYANISSLPATAGSIAESIKGGYRVTTQLDYAKYSGRQLYLGVNITASGMQLKDGFDFRVLTAAGMTASSSSSAVSSAASSQQASSQQASSQQASSQQASSQLSSSASGASSSAAARTPGLPDALLRPAVLIPSAAGLALIIAAVTVLLLLRGKKAHGRAETQQSEAAGTTPTDIQTTLAHSQPGQQDYAASLSGDTQAVPNPAPAAVLSSQAAPAGITVRLINITNRRKPVTISLNLVDRAVIGSDRGCDAVFAEDHSMSGRHCQLSYIDKKILINALGSERGTIVNGVPISGTYRLEPDDLLVVGSTELRVMF